jgi:hypothetical protein
VIDYLSFRVEQMGVRMYVCMYVRRKVFIRSDGRFASFLPFFFFFSTAILPLNAGPSVFKVPLKGTTLECRYVRT